MADGPHECKYCLASCRDGEINHGKGCYVESPNGGGSTPCDCATLPSPVSATWRSRPAAELIADLRACLDGDSLTCICVLRESPHNVVADLLQEIEQLQAVVRAADEVRGEIRCRCTSDETPRIADHGPCRCGYCETSALYDAARAKVELT